MSQGAKARFLFVVLYAALKRRSSTVPLAFASFPRRGVGTKLIAVVGVDVEAEDGVDFDGMGASHGRAELPVG
jgi:hypothetical protein